MNLPDVQALAHDQSQHAGSRVHEIVREVARALTAKPFQPHPLLRQGHAQTLAAAVAARWRRRFPASLHAADESRLFEVEPQVRLLAHCRWQREPTTHPTLLLLHGLEGSSASNYMLGAANLAFRAGFNVVRLNQRNCGATEHLTPTLYHSGMSGDLTMVVRELIEHDRLPSLFVAGFSMGGNIVLKMAGEFGALSEDAAPRELSGVVAVSPSLNLSECAARIEWRSNWIYRQSFMRSLRRRIRHKKRLFPLIYGTDGVRHMRTVREFDEYYTSRHGGFANADDYYARSSALPFMSQIRIPTLIIHAQDDPIIPFDSFQHPSLINNPHIILLTPPRGGHVAFISAAADEAERFWAESRLVEFCKLVATPPEPHGGASVAETR